MESSSKRLCELLGIERPVVQAPVGRPARPPLAAAVSEAGGLGMLALTWCKRDSLREEIRRTRALTSRPFGVNFVVPWATEEQIHECIAAGVRIFSFSWGDFSSFASLVKGSGGQVMHMVGSADEAAASAEAGADVVIVQGIDAGGHLLGKEPTSALVAATTRRVRTVPVLAAGGVADDRDAARMLALGASGVYVGTRFVATHESAAHDVYKAALVRAGEGDTIMTELFDVGWPGAPHRALVNSTVAAWLAAGRPVPGRRRGEGDVVGAFANGIPILRYEDVAPTRDVHGDVESMALYAGESVRGVTRVESAKDVVAALGAGMQRPRGGG